MYYQYRQIEEVHCTVPDQHDTLFLTSTSFERRCTFAPDKLSVDYKAKNFVIVRYRERHVIVSGSKRLNFDDTYSKLSEQAKISNGKVLVLECNTEDPLDGYIELLEILEQLKRQYELPTITLDMSTFTKQYILLFIKALFDSKVYLRVLYTSAQNYQTQLTWGVKSIVSVPFYNGHQISRNGTVLVIFLGYERERSLAVWKSCEPIKTVAVVCKTENRNGSSLTQAERLNKHLISISEAEVKRINRFDINETINVLEELQTRYPEEKYNVVVSPLSTKVQALGLGLFFQEIARVAGRCPFSVQYSIPFDYAKEYSLGGLNLWQYDIGLIGFGGKQ